MGSDKVGSYTFREHFLTGDSPGLDAESGNIGLGWYSPATSNFAIQHWPGETEHPGVVLLATSTTASAVNAAMALTGVGTTTQFVASNLTEFRVQVRTTSFIDSMSIIVGFGSEGHAAGNSDDLGTHGVFFLYNGSTSRWQGVAQVSSVGTAVSGSGPVVATDSWYILEASFDSGQWEFFVNGTSIGTININVPTTEALTSICKFRKDATGPGVIRSYQVDEFVFQYDLSALSVQSIGVPTNEGPIAADRIVAGPHSLKIDSDGTWEIDEVPGTVGQVLQIDSFGQAVFAVSPGSSSNLSRTFYCDGQTTVVLADQTGNIEAPFATLQQGIDAAALSGGSTLDTVIAIGSFTENITITKDLRISSIAPNIIAQVTGDWIIDAATVKLHGIQVLGTTTLTTGPTVTAINCLFGGTITGVNAVLHATGTLFQYPISVGEGNLDDCLIGDAITLTNGSAVTAWHHTEAIGLTTIHPTFEGYACAFVYVDFPDGSPILEDCVVGNDLTANLTTVTLRDTVLLSGSITTAGHLNLSDCTVVPGVVTAGTLFAEGCTLSDVVLLDLLPNRLSGTSYTALTGPAGASVDCDAFSASGNTSGVAVINGTIIRTVRAPRASLAVVVPVVAAGAIGSGSVSLSGTPLEGLSVDSQVVANEPTAGITGGGFIAGVQISSTNNVTFKFFGPCTGGSQTFIVTHI